MIFQVRDGAATVSLVLKNLGATVNELKSDFVGVAELAVLTGLRRSTLYDQHHTKRGALAPILVKFGNRVGSWRLDYERFVASQLRLTPTATERASA